jgi:Na+/H+-dicarboxylate symporter
MYLALVCTAIAQIYHLPLTTPKLAEFILLAVLLCVGTITVPGGGIMALTIAVTTLHLPAESIALFASIDWFVGMFRTVANVIGDVTTAVIIDHEEAG